MVDEGELLYTTKRSKSKWSLKEINCFPHFQAKLKILWNTFIKLYYYYIKKIKFMGIICVWIAPKIHNELLIELTM